MQSSSVRTRWFAPFAVCAVMAMAMLMSAPAAASAAPTEPIMTLATLQSRLATAPGGVVSGYLKTVLQGTTISTIPVSVLDVASSGSAGVDDTGASSYIVFVATGPVMDRLGSIAAGMSGSPIYVPDGGQDKLIGALSYGDIFSTDGSGLATPIESMMGLESAYPLFLPMSAASASRGPVTVRLHANAARRLGTATFTGAPLSAVEIGGLPSSAPGLVAVKAALKAKGVDLLVGSSMSAASSPSDVATLEGGASVTALASRGDVWWGGLGTVTYATTSTVVAFGHPMFWGGPSDLYMTNAWVDHTWPSAYEPYKMGAPTAVRGTIEQDRGVGILGAIGPLPVESTITASATDIDSGHTANSVTYMPTDILSSDNENYSMIPFLSTYAAGYDAEDRLGVTGSALTTTTVVVRDGSQLFTIVRRNVWDADAESAGFGDDLPVQLIGDVNNIVGDLQFLGTNGLAHPQILSVDLKSRMTRARASAQIADVALSAPLKIGANRIKVLLNVWGVPDTQTVDATLTLPPGTSLTGRITAWGGGGGLDDSSGSSGITIKVGTGGGITITTGPGGSGGSSDAAQTTTQDIDALMSSPLNSDIMIDYDSTTEAVLPLMASATSASSGAIEATASSPWFVSGQVDKAASTVALEPFPSPIAYGGSALVAGFVDESADSPGMVAVLGQQAGTSTVTTLAVVPLDDDGTFETSIDGLTRNTLVTARYLGDDETLPSQATRQLHVTAALGLKASASRVKHGAKITLTATVLPSDATGSVVFEYRSGTKWLTIGGGAIASGKAVFAWKTPKGHFSIRARYSGPTNYGGTSRAVSVTGT